jgi:aldose 1-epimerase
LKKPGPAENRIALASGDYGLIVAPQRGGSILAFTWRDRPLLRAAAGPGILDVACFPIVPYSNRISAGTFILNGKLVTLAPNFPAVDPRSPLHGSGWLSDWAIAGQTASSLQLVHWYPGGEWPWAYRADMSYVLDADGLTAHLRLTNLAAEPMPAGLGFHPYFPRSTATRYMGRHQGEWQTDSSGLPTTLKLTDCTIDWWDGKPVCSRPVDTVYTGRDGYQHVVWPDQSLALRIDCTENLSCTSVYVPQDADWFCAEPVSHMTDAVNRQEDGAAMATLQPGDTLEAAMRLQAHMLASPHEMSAV